MAKYGVEGVLLSTLQELGRVFGGDRVISAAGQVLQTAARTKATVDGNVASVLSLAGLPSRSDIDALRRQMDVMQATLSNLSRKLDRLLEENATRDATSPSPARRRRTPPT